jgi:hypothetical protein
MLHISEADLFFFDPIKRARRQRKGRIYKYKNLGQCKDWNFKNVENWINLKKRSFLCLDENIVKSLP